MHQLTSNKIKLNQSPQAYGELHSSNELLDKPLFLRKRLEDDGFIYIQNFFDKDQIQQVRQDILRTLSLSGLLENAITTNEVHLKPEYFRQRVHPQLCKVPEVRRLIHGGKLEEFFSLLLGGKSRPFDYIWVRTIAPSTNTTPHCDHVYMSYGARRLYSTWIPIGDVPRSHGSLMLLERSHKAEKLKNYRAIDVQKMKFWSKLRFKHGKLFRVGHYSKDINKVQQELGLRWLTTDFSAGDLVIFSTKLLHATLDNKHDQFRLSIDARFQLASDPIDPRFVGENFDHLKAQSLLSGILRKFSGREA